MTREWEELTEQEQNAQLYSDLFKDSNGFRPSGVLWESFASQKTAEQEAELQSLTDEVSAQVAAEEAQLRGANAHFFSKVEEIMEARSQGFRDAVVFYFFQNGKVESMDDADNIYFGDVESWLYQEGLSFCVCDAVVAEMCGLDL